MPRTVVLPAEHKGENVIVKGATIKPDVMVGVHGKNSSGKGILILHGSLKVYIPSYKPDLLVVVSEIKKDVNNLKAAVDDIANMLSTFSSALSTMQTTAATNISPMGGMLPSVAIAFCTTMSPAISQLSTNLQQLSQTIKQQASDLDEDEKKLD